MGSDAQIEHRHALIDSARRRTLQEFESAVAKGERQPADELPEYRRRRRDYASWQRMGEASPEAVDLARTLATQLASMPEPEFRDFALEVNAMLIDLYDAFIARAG